MRREAVHSEPSCVDELGTDLLRALPPLQALLALKEAAVHGGGGGGGGGGGTARALPDVGTLTVAQLQEALKLRGLGTQWSPLKGKKDLVDRLQARTWLGYRVDLEWIRAPVGVIQL